MISSVNPVTWVKAANRIVRLQPDLVLFVWWMPFFGPCYSTIARLIKRRSTARIGFLVENYISHENRWFDRFWSRATLDLADGFIAQSSFVRKQIEAVHEQPVYQTTLSVFDCYDLGNYDRATARAALHLPADEPVCLFFGLIRPYKGLAALIEAFPLVLQEEKCRLLIVGEAYEDTVGYETRIERLGIGDQTTFLNQFIPNEEVERYFKAADFLCLPYNSATQSGILMMGYGLRRPVIVTDVGGLRELVKGGKTGMVIPDNQPHTVAEAILTIIRSREDFAANIEGLADSLGYLTMDEIIHSLLRPVP